MWCRAQIGSINIQLLLKWGCYCWESIWHRGWWRHRLVQKIMRNLQRCAGVLLIICQTLSALLCILIRFQSAMMRDRERMKSVVKQKLLKLRQLYYFPVKTNVTQREWINSWLSQPHGAVKSKKYLIFLSLKIQNKKTTFRCFTKQFD